MKTELMWFGIVFMLCLVAIAAIGGVVLEEQTESELEECLERCGSSYLGEVDKMSCIENCIENLAYCDMNEALREAGHGVLYYVPVDEESE